MVQLTADEGETYTPEVILVTGGAGFIASHLVIRLVNRFPHYKVRCSTGCKTSRYAKLMCPFFELSYAVMLSSCTSGQA